MKKHIATIIAGIALAIGAPSNAQNTTSALLPIPNSINVCNDGHTFEIDNNTIISTTLPKESFIVGELQRIIGKRLNIYPAIG